MRRSDPYSRKIGIDNKFKQTDDDIILKPSMQLSGNTRLEKSKRRSRINQESYKGRVPRRRYMHLSGDYGRTVRKLRNDEHHMLDNRQTGMGLTRLKESEMQIRAQQLALCDTRSNPIHSRGKLDNFPKKAGNTFAPNNGRTRNRSFRPERKSRFARSADDHDLRGQRNRSQPRRGAPERNYNQERYPPSNDQLREKDQRGCHWGHSSHRPKTSDSRSTAASPVRKSIDRVRKSSSLDPVKRNRKFSPIRKSRFDKKRQMRNPKATTPRGGSSREKNWRLLTLDSRANTTRWPAGYQEYDEVTDLPDLKKTPVDLDRITHNRVDLKHGFSQSDDERTRAVRSAKDKKSWGKYLRKKPIKVDRGEEDWSPTSLTKFLTRREPDDPIRASHRKKKSWHGKKGPKRASYNNWVKTRSPHNLQERMKVRNYELQNGGALQPSIIHSSPVGLKAMGKEPSGRLKGKQVNGRGSPLRTQKNGKEWRNGQSAKIVSQRNPQIRRKIQKARSASLDGSSSLNPNSQGSDNFDTFANDEVDSNYDRKMENSMNNYIIENDHVDRSANLPDGGILNVQLENCIPAVDSGPLSSGHLSYEHLVRETLATLKNIEESIRPSPGRTPRQSNDRENSGVYPSNEYQDEQKKEDRAERKERKKKNKAKKKSKKSNKPMNQIWGGQDSPPVGNKSRNSVREAYIQDENHKPHDVSISREPVPPQVRSKQVSSSRFERKTQDNGSTDFESSQTKNRTRGQKKPGSRFAKRPDTKRQQRSFASEDSKSRKYQSSTSSSSSPSEPYVPFSNLGQSDGQHLHPPVGKAENPVLYPTSDLFDTSDTSSSDNAGTVRDARNDTSRSTQKGRKKPRDVFGDGSDQDDRWASDSSSSETSESSDDTKDRKKRQSSTTLSPQKLEREVTGSSGLAVPPARTEASMYLVIPRQ